MITRFRWLICALLFFATTINYMDRQILSLLKPILDKEIGWTNEQFGAVNSVFQAFYGLGLLGFGFVIDRIGVKTGYALSITGWSLAAAAHALVSSVFGFQVARAFLGLTEAGNFPAAVSAVAQWFPKRERALATSLFNAGANAGAMVAPALVPVIASHWGWQAAFVVAGIAGLCWLLLWLPLYSLPRQSRHVSPDELALIESDPVTPQAKVPWSSLLGYKQTWAVLVLKIFTDPVWWFFLIWLPDFFKKGRGLDIKASWHYLVAIYGLVTVLSIAAGWFTGRLMQRGWDNTRARKTVMLGCAFCVLPILGVTHVDGLLGPGHDNAANWCIVLIIAFAGAAHQAWSANLFCTISDMFPKEAVASVTGLAGMAGCVSGIAFPLFCGWVLDRQPGNAGYAILFGCCGFAYLIAFAINHLLAPRFDPINSAKGNASP